MIVLGVLGILDLKIGKHSLFEMLNETKVLHGTVIVKIIIVSFSHTNLRVVTVPVENYPQM